MLICVEYPGCHLDDAMSPPVPLEPLALASFLYYLIGNVLAAL